MNAAAVADVLLAVFAGVGLVVCLSAGVALSAWSIGFARYQLRRANVVWKHESAVREALAEWRARNPQRLTELARLHDQLES